MWGALTKFGGAVVRGSSSPDPTSLTGAVCKFCLDRQSELYQKEVSGKGQVTLLQGLRAGIPL